MLNRNDIGVLVLSIIILALGTLYSNSNITSIGLTLDVTGFLLLWWYGLPSNFKPQGKIVRTEWDVELNENEKGRYRFAQLVSNASVLLIVTGFILQYLGSLNEKL